MALTKIKEKTDYLALASPLIQGRQKEAELRIKLKRQQPKVEVMQKENDRALLGGFQA